MDEPEFQELIGKKSIEKLLDEQTSPQFFHYLLEYMEQQEDLGLLKKFEKRLEELYGVVYEEAKVLLDVQNYILVNNDRIKIPIGYMCKDEISKYTTILSD